MVRVATSEVSEKDIEGGGNYPAPGMYHVLVDTVREMVEENYVALDFVVLAGAPSDPAAGDQSGKKITERFYLTGKTDEASKVCSRRLSRVAVELGLIERSQLGQEDLDIEFTLAEGRDCVIKVKEEEYTKKSGEKAKRNVMDFFGIWNPNHEDVQQVPRYPSWGGASATASAASTPSGSKSPQPAAAVAASKAADDFDDI